MSSPRSQLGDNPRSAVSCSATLVAGVIAAWCVSGVAHAYRIESGTLPDPKSLSVGKPHPTGGLMLQVRSSGFDGSGYTPFEFEFTDATPSTRDRRIEISLKRSAWSGPRSRLSEMRFESTLVLPAKATKAQTRVLAQLTPNAYFTWEIKVDGAPEPWLQQLPGSPWSFAIASPSNGLHLLRAVASETAIGAGPLLPTPVQAPGGPPVQAPAGLQLGGVIQLGNINLDLEALPIPPDWMGISGADFVVLDRAELGRIAESAPDRFRALLAWIAAGGTLWVEGLGAKSAALTELSELLGLEGWRIEEGASDEGPETAGAAAGAGRGGIEGLARDLLQPEGGAAAGSAGDGAQPEEPLPSRRRTPRTPVAGQTGWYWESLAARSPGVLSAILGDGGRSTSRGWYATHPLGFGQVQAFPYAFQDAPKRVPQSARDVASMRWRQQGWSERHGVSPLGVSAVFGKMMIPGVGLAPVVEFQALITLFVLLIGPVNYWLLHRAGRLPLLVLTTPALSLLVTVALLGYAALTDGFGVRVRARSVTMINQRAGQMTTWGHTTHYAGSAPPGGLVYPSDTEVTPIEPSWEGSLASPAMRQRVIRWEGDRQMMPQGWLPSRTTTQSLVVRSARTQKQVVLTGASKGWTAANRLGASISLLLVRAPEGDWLRATDVAPDQTVRLASVPRGEAAVELRRWIIENEPEFAVGAGAAIEDALEVLPTFGPRNRGVDRSEAYDFDSNLLNHQIDRLSGLDGGRPLDLAPRTYVAITESTVETPLGIDGAREIGSFHVVIGTW